LVLGMATGIPCAVHSVKLRMCSLTWGRVEMWRGGLG
jgi:hypothetical protein